MSRRTQTLLWAVAAFAGTAGLVAALIRERRPVARRHALFVVGEPEKGEALFFGEKRCSLCHSVNGRGGNTAVDLGSIHPGKPAMGWFAAVLWNHGPKMWRKMEDRGTPQLNQEEMGHLLAFLYRAGTGQHEGDAEAGRRVFVEKGCAACHAARPAAGGAAVIFEAARSGDPVAWARAMWNHAQSMVEPITKRTGEWPEFLGDEMNDLMAFAGRGSPSTGFKGAFETVLRGSAERGWNVFENKCMQCHSVSGKGGRIGPELGPERDLPHSISRFAAVLWNHAPSMWKHARRASLSVPRLDGEEIKDVQTFLMSLRYFEPSGSPFLGERVFRERGCARCHGARGEGAAEGPNLRTREAFTTVSLATSLWRHGPEMWSRAERLGITWPNLESTDVGDLISFLNAPAQRR